MKVLKILLLLAVLVFVGFKVYYHFKYSYNGPGDAMPKYGSFDEYYKAKLATSKQLGVSAGNEERLVRYSPRKTKVALLYIHGYSASRAEGESVIDELAHKYEANTYYLRLPGHGLSGEVHAKATFKDYVDEVELAMQMMPQLGEKVVLVGCSMGGLLTTYLAAKYPDKVDGLILASPFFDYASSMGFAMKLPGIVSLLEQIDGPKRSMVVGEEFKSRVKQGYNNHWTQGQYNEALGNLEDMRAFAARSKYYKNVKCPVLMLYYYKDEEHQDKAASVAEMLNVFEKLGSEQKQEIAIEDANHVLLSHYVRTDKETIIKALNGFVEQKILN